MNPMNRRRLAAFRASKRGMISLTIFGLLFFLSLFAELLANDKPILIRYDGAFYSPLVKDYPETTFGGDFPTNTVYSDPEVQKLIEAKGWILWPPIPYSYDTVLKGEGRTTLQPPSRQHWLGTDDSGRDVMARLIYGFRISVLFGLALTVASTVIGIAAGAVQGYFGGVVDLLMQRFLEIWSSLPTLYLLIILASFIQPGFGVLLGIMLLFSWMALVGLVRAEFLRGRNFDYVRAARALGMLDARIMFRHILPNAMTAALTYLPFIARAVIDALKAHPNINASYNEETGEITYYDAEHLGFAVDTEQGLLSPVVHNAGDLSLAGLARAINDIAGRARSGNLKPDELSGGTFTITNIGSQGALFDTPILVPPQAAMLGTGAIVKRPRVIADEFGNESIGVRSVCYLPLTYDHRLIDGADAGRFLTTVRKRLEEGAFEGELGL